MSKDMLGVAVRKLVTTPSSVLGVVCDLLEKISSDPEWVEATKRFLRKENPWPECPWREEDGVIYFTVTSDGTTGPEWIERLESAGNRLYRWAKDVLRSEDFRPTNGVTTEVAVLKGDLFSDAKRTTKNIRAEAERRELKKPNAEVACLIREKFSDEELEAMGLMWLVTMHEPIEDSAGGPLLLFVSWLGFGRWLSAAHADPVDGWDRVDGFAFRK